MKIDLDWIQKELDAGREVELECVDIIGLLKDIDRSETNEKILDQGALIVDYIDYDGDIRLVGNIGDLYFNVIVSEEFKYFRIKRTSNYDPIEGEGTLPSLNLQGKGTPIYSKINSQNSDPDLSDKPTFDDLIDVAIKAQKDGLIHKVEIISRRSIYVSEKPTSKSAHFNLTSIEAGISFINSLYTETFVIGKLDDLKKINLKNSVVKFLNGFESQIKSVDWQSDGGNISLYDGEFYVDFDIIKGATVTQKR